MVIMMMAHWHYDNSQFSLYRLSRLTLSTIKDTISRLFCMMFKTHCRRKSMAWYQTAVTPLLTHWSYCSPTLSHRCDPKDILQCEPSLKRECRHFDVFLIHLLHWKFSFDNVWCSQQWQFHKKWKSFPLSDGYVYIKDYRCVIKCGQLIKCAISTVFVLFINITTLTLLFHNT